MFQTTACFRNRHPGTSTVHEQQPAVHMQKPSVGDRAPNLDPCLCLAYAWSKLLVENTSAAGGERPNTHARTHNLLRHLTIILTTFEQEKKCMIAHDRIIGCRCAIWPYLRQCDVASFKLFQSIAERRLRSRMHENKHDYDTWAEPNM